MKRIWVSRTWASPSPKDSPCLSTFLGGRKYVHLISICYLSLRNFKRLMWNNLEQLWPTNCSQSNYLVTILKWLNRWKSISQLDSSQMLVEIRCLNLCRHHSPTQGPGPEFWVLQGARWTNFFSAIHCFRSSLLSSSPSQTKQISSPDWFQPDGCASIIRYNNYRHIYLHSFIHICA